VPDFQIPVRYDEAVPIVLLTADGRSAEKAHQVRARDYLNKPFELDDLVTVVRRALEAPSRGAGRSPA
jgi:DNA-binding NtrC family response regulator